jgi:hypothetical protein
VAIEQILIPVTIHAGKKIVDIIIERVSKGQNPVVDQSFNVGVTSRSDGRTAVDKGFTTRQNQPGELIVGNFYFPYTVNYLLTGEELVLVIVTEEMNQQVLFFLADQEGYELFLPHGAYSFLVLLVAMAGIDDPFYADILAIGLPSAVDLSGIEDLLVEEYDDIWTLLIHEPLGVSYGGPFYLDFVLLDTFEHPELPDTLWQLFAN